MANLTYFFIALGILIIFGILDGISHQKFSKKATTLVHAIGLPIFLISMFVLAYLEFNLSVFIVPGLIIVVIGLIIAYKGTIEIKKHFLKASSVYKKGIYSKIRHPIYLGLIISLLGFFLVVYSLVFFIYIIAIIMMLLWFIYYEEKHLIKRFGKQYLNYKKQTSMFIPLK